VAAEVVPLADVPDEGLVSPAARDDERRRRAAHVAWRYRT
jgi:hypothetical protein